MGGRGTEKRHCNPVDRDEFIRRVGAMGGMFEAYLKDKEDNVVPNGRREVDSKCLAARITIRITGVKPPDPGTVWDEVCG
jgi:hypothetical protein